jgi:sugar (glycoside-pentoside-hexuronide) transporter
MSGGIFLDTTTALPVTEDTDRLPLKGRVSYGMLDMAGQLTCFVSAYFMYYLTDVAGIAALAAGTLMFLTRIVDFIDAPAWGIIIDHTHSKYGQCRPWFLWLPIPYAIICAFIFLTPDIGEGNLLIYISIFYILYNLVFTGLNTPLTAILPLLTKSSKERIVLNSYRMVGSNLGTMLMNATALPLVALLGAGNDKKGFFLTAAIFGIVAIFMQFYSFANLREINTEIKKKVKKMPLKESFKAVKGNWPWLIIVISNLLFWIGMICRNVSSIYYFSYNLGHKDLVPFLNTIGAIGIISIIAMPYLCRHMKKCTAWSGGLVTVVIGQTLMYFAQSNIPFLIVGWSVSNLGISLACSIPFAMLSSTVDFGEWKTGVRSAGFLTAVGSSFCIKAGCGIGAAIPGAILAYFGYVANTTQSAESLAGISFAFIWLPVIIFIAAIIPLLFYHKYEGMETQIRTDLEARALAEAAE